MKNLTKILAGVTAVVGIVGPLVLPYLTQLISAHPNLAALLATVSTILALFHNPVATPAK